jgi:capsular polysaccharide transport system permease protein
MDVFIARALLELFTWVASTFIIIGSLIALDFGPLPRSVATMAVAILALFAIGFGAGTTLGILGQFYPSLDHILKIPNRVLYFTSGVFFLPEILPPTAREVIDWNPVMHGITLFREGYYPGYDSNMLDVDYLFGWSVGAVLVAFAAERLSRRSIRSIA